jgi:protein gp37
VVHEDHADPFTPISGQQPPEAADVASRRFDELNRRVGPRKAQTGHVVEHHNVGINATWSEPVKRVWLNDKLDIAARKKVVRENRFERLTVVRVPTGNNKQPGCHGRRRQCSSMASRTAWAT